MTNEPISINYYRKGNYLKVLENAKLFHDEHREFDIPPGTYIVDKVKEYDHFLEETRDVLD